jgi:outer membrane beta-barrel protein
MLCPRLTITLCLALLLACAITLAAGDARAQAARAEAPRAAAEPGPKPKAKPAADAKKDEEGSVELRERFFGADIAVLQRRYFLRRHRVGLAVGGVYNLNDQLQRHYGAGGALRFHISERHAIGVRGFAYRNQGTDLETSVQRDLQVVPERTDLRYEGQLAWSYSPIDGKFSYFGLGIAYYDIYLQLGGGVIGTFNSELLPAALAGIGGRVYLTRWLALELEVDDTIYSEPYRSETHIMQNVVVSLCAAVYMPFSPKYRGSR